MWKLCFQLQSLKRIALGSSEFLSYVGWVQWRCGQLGLRCGRQEESDTGISEIQWYVPLCVEIVIYLLPSHFECKRGKPGLWIGILFSEGFVSCPSVMSLHPIPSLAEDLLVLESCRRIMINLKEMHLRAKYLVRSLVSA